MDSTPKSKLTRVKIICLHITLLCVSQNYQTELFVEERKKKEEEKIKYSMKYEVRCGAGPFRSGP